MTALLAGIAMTAACATQPMTGKAAAHDSHITLLPGQSAPLADGSRLQFVAVAEDSRCPLDVQCIWAGDAKLALQWLSPDASPVAITLHTNTVVGPDHAQAGHYRFTLIELAREQPLARIEVTSQR